jgi:hypothetical protein
MTGATVETSPQLYARMAGVSYLLGSVTSVAGQMVIRGMLVVSADGAATAANILAHESLLRLGFASSFMAVPFHIAWAILFYELFKPVNRSVSLLAAFVMLMGCTMWVLSSLFLLSPLLVLQRGNVTVYKDSRPAAWTVATYFVTYVLLITGLTFGMPTNQAGRWMT